MCEVNTLHFSSVECAHNLVRDSETTSVSAHDPMASHSAIVDPRPGFVVAACYVSLCQNMWWFLSHAKIVELLPSDLMSV